MLCIGRVLFDLQTVKKGVAVLPVRIIGGQHIKSHGLSESSRAAHAQIFLLCADQPVDNGDQHALIHINLRPETRYKIFTSRI